MFYQETNLIVSCRAPIEFTIMKFEKKLKSFALTVGKKYAESGRIVSEFVTIKYVKI